MTFPICNRLRRQTRAAVLACWPLALLALGCGNEHGAAKAALPSRWFAGDFHVHTSIGSNDTGSVGGLRSLPELVKATALERGMSFVLITDHSNSAGSDVTTTVEDFHEWNQGPEFPVWDTAASLSDETFLMVDGSEISPVSLLEARTCPDCPTLGTATAEPRGHIGCAPLDLATFDLGAAFIDRPPGAVTGGASVGECLARGGFAIINHPFYQATKHIEYDWTSYDYHAIEVWNGTVGYSTYDRFAYDAYLCDRLAGRSTVAVGGSDNHRTALRYDGVPNTDPPLGLPMTSVFAEKLEWGAIIGAVRAGRIVIHDQSTFVSFEVSRNGEVVGGVGDTVTPATAAVRLTGRSPRAQALRFVRAAPGSCNDRRRVGRDSQPVVPWVTAFETTVCPDGPCEFDVARDLNLEPGLYFAIVGVFGETGLNLRDTAVTNVLQVDL